LIEYLIGDNEFQKYQYVKQQASKRKIELRTFDTKSWKNFEEYLPNMLSKTLFSEKHMVFCDFKSGLSKKRREYLKERLELIKDSDENFLFLSMSRPLERKAKKRAFKLPKPWKDDEWMQLVIGMARDKGVKLSHEKLKRLLYETDKDLWKINSELEKFTAVKHPDEAFDSLFYSYSRKQLREFCYTFCDRTSLRAADDFDRVLREYQPQQIIFFLQKTYLDLYKLMFIAPRKERFNFNELRELSGKSKLSIPVLSALTGFTFKNEPPRRSLLMLYSEKEMEAFLEQLLMIERGFKTGRQDFRTGLLAFFNSTRRG